MFQGTKATPFICNTVFQNRSLMSEISLFCEDHLISTHTVVRTDAFGHDIFVKRYIYFESRKDLFLGFWEHQKGRYEMPPQPQTCVASENVRSLATRKAYVTQIGCVCFRSDQLGQPQGQGVPVHFIRSSCFIEALGKREEKTSKETRLWFLQC